MLFRKVKLDDNVTSKKNKFININNSIIDVTNDYERFALDYKKYVENILKINLTNDDVFRYIFLETVMTISKNGLWNMTSEPIIDIMDTALGEAMDTDEYFDFRDLTNMHPELDNIINGIVSTYSNYDIVDYIVTEDNQLKLVLTVKAISKPKIKFIFTLPPDLDLFFTIYNVSNKRAETLYFISKLIDIALATLSSNGDYETNLEEEIENLLLQNKLYSDIDVRTTNEMDYNAIIVNRDDYKLLKKCIPIFTDEILRQNLTFKALDVLIEDVVNKKIIGYIRGDF